MPLDPILAADSVVFATPIWWNNHSSLLQRAIEYLDDVNDQDLAAAGVTVNGTIHPTARSSFAAKVLTVPAYR